MERSLFPVVFVSSNLRKIYIGKLYYSELKGKLDIILSGIHGEY